MNRLNVRDVNHAGLLRGVDAGVTHDAISHDILLTNRVWENLGANLRANLRKDFSVDPCLWALGARREELFILRLVELHDK